MQVGPATETGWTKVQVWQEDKLAGDYVLRESLAVPGSGGWGGVGDEALRGVEGRVKLPTAVTVVQGAPGAEPARAPSERK